MFRKKEWILTGIGILIFLLVGIISCYPKKQNNSIETEVVPKEIVIQIEGEVVRPATLTFYQSTNYGVVLKRIQYLLNIYSDIHGFDLKEQIHTSMTIVIPTIDGNNDYNENQKIHINQATQEELMMLYQIGEKRSEKILAYRLKNGSFKNWKDFWEVVSISNEETQKRIKKQAIL